jgi:hypothetical protein
MTTFSSKAEYRYGLAGESAIALWLRSHGFTVLPVYEKLVDEGKGPQLYLPVGSVIAPDLLAFSAEKVLWIEAKHKTAFTWHRITGRWVTGNDLRHYIAYQKVDRETPWRVWLLFLHDGGQAKDSPENSPRGLFGNALARLVMCENHRSDKWGHSGMVYWAIGSLIKLANYGP